MRIKMDNQLVIKALKDIQELCRSTVSCREDCPFFINKPQLYVGCWFLLKSESDFPVEWDISLIEEKENKNERH